MKAVYPDADTFVAAFHPNTPPGTDFNLFDFD